MRILKSALWTSAALIGLALIVTAPATADQVILDDLIVDGSACIGFDCVNGESFGFDTIRIKENNLRIRAQDTSSTASFPSNDWQITFNDSANGGANKFSIDDIDGGRTPFTIEAGAPSHSLYVDDGGRLGLGTNTPVVDVHIKSGNTPTLRLEQDGSSGFTPQTWDVAGNEANFFIRDATGGSTLPFRIRPGGALTGSIDIQSNGDVRFGGATSGTDVEITEDGRIGIGTTFASGPSNQLHVVGTARLGGASPILRMQDDDTGNNWQLATNNDGSIQLNGNAVGGIEMKLETNGDVVFAGTVNGVSDRNAKENFVQVDVREALARVVALPISTWNYKNVDASIRHMGPMAQDFRAAFGLGKNDTTIALSDASATALAAIQGLSQVLHERDAEVASLEQRLAELETLVAAFGAQ